MIEKQRLEELIKQKATIYQIRDNIIVDYQLCSCNYLEDNELIYENVLTNYCKIWIGKLENFFETEEDAKFALKFKRIPRTEYLDLPTWEEIDAGYETEFDNSCLEVYKTGNRILVKTNRNYLDLYDYIFDKPATKENYLLACELCRKLWLGEEV